MMLRARFAGTLALALVTSAAAATLPAAERVRFASLDAAGGEPVMIDALWFRPPDAGGRPVPVVVALHGCGGLYRDTRDGEATLTPRHAAHAQALLAAGYAVLFPDSLGSRGLREICTHAAGRRALRPPSRRLDALGALRWLAGRADVARERIALLGWSNGGTTALATIDAGHRDVAAFRARHPLAFFRGAVAFYPGCTPALSDTGWRPAVPTRIYIGADDDWTPASACAALDARAQREGWPLEVVVYAGAHHGFDAPRGRVVHRTDVPGGVNPGRGVHVGPHAEARADAQRRLAAFLREVLAPPR